MKKKERNGRRRSRENQSRKYNNEADNRNIINLQPDNEAEKTANVERHLGWKEKG